MMDDLESRIDRLTPRPAPPELRGRILEAVACELTAQEAPRPRRRFRAGVATAALLLLAACLDLLATRADQARLSRTFGPRPASREARELALEAAEYGGPEAGRWVLDRLAASPPSTPTTTPTTEADLRRRARDLERLARDPNFDPREIDDEATPQAVPQVDRDRRRPPFGRLLALECGLHLDHRPSA